jgi:hypothetical protein
LLVLVLLILASWSARTLDHAVISAVKPQPSATIAFAGVGLALTCLFELVAAIA